MRRAPFFLVPVLVLAGLVGSATGAAAKCIPGMDGCPEVTLARATLKGPGLGVPIVIDDDDFWAVARQAGLDSYRPTLNSPASTEPGDEAIGPKYVLTLVVKISDGRSFRATRDVYPYAVNTIVPGVPVAWTWSERPQTFIESFEGFVEESFTAEGGWYRSASLYRTLVDHGLPETSPVPMDAPAAGPADSAATDEPGSNVSASWLVIALLGGLAVLLVGGAVSGRPRSRPSLP
jgi:hypothetical protein